MRLTLIGHASLLIETADCRVLMDPVLWDPHQEGLFHVHPAREVLHARLPPLDVLVISHRHLDHFDIRSLAHLPRQVQVVVPQDPLLEKSLRALGFEEVHALAPLTEFFVGGTRFVTTPSRAPVREFGLVIQDETGTCFNAVDTVLDASAVAAVRQVAPTLDVFLASWQPMLEVDFQWNRPVAFPVQRYAELLGHVAALEPRAVVPGANGFRYCGISSWLNQVVFPVSRARFCVDVKRARGDCAVFPMDPGDVLEFGAAGFRLDAGGASFVRRLPEARVSLDYRPVDFDGRLVDGSCAPDEAAAIRASVERVMDVELPRFLEEADATCWRLHQQHGVVQQLEVVFPDERLSWCIDFTASPPRMARGASSLATVHSLVTASVLHGIASGTRTWDYAIMGGFYRRFLTFEPQAPLSDPLRLRFPSGQAQASVIEAEVARWAGVRPLSSARAPRALLQRCGVFPTGATAR